MAASLLASIVVPARDAEATLAGCLRALSRQSLARERYEIIVVDDGSRDGTAALAEAAADRVVRIGTAVGAAGARNAGVAAAQGAIVVFTDADCEPTEGFLESLLAPLRDPDVGGAKGAYLSRQRSVVARFVQLEYEDRYRLARRRREIDFVDTYAACFRRAELERVGGFDERLRYVEDQELSFRLAEAGVRLRFAPEARTYHRHADSLRAYVGKKFRIAWWKVAVLRRHPRKLLRDSHTPQTLKAEMAAAAGVVLGLAALAVLPPTVLGVPAWWLPATAAAAFFALALPFAVRASSRDPLVAFLAPGLLFLRDLALATGLALGVLAAPKLASKPAR